MESLLENPVRAVLYLKELTTIVQNQQSLIHTQRQRIDELERRLDELSTENRNLREQHPAPPPPDLQPPPPPLQGQQEQLQHHQQLPAQQPPNRQAQPGPSGSSSGGGGGSSSTRAPAHQHPPLQPHQHPQEKDSRERSCCTALLQHKPPQAIGKGVLSRRPENETVLHQFCCPAADAEQKPSSLDSSPRWEFIIFPCSSPFCSSFPLSLVMSFSFHTKRAPLALLSFIPHPSPPHLSFPAKNTRLLTFTQPLAF
uniref:IQ motif and SEC7 domain-containing protein 3 n=1 Tax=Sphenodon punctatus TaxID=8508 RepID=A0A8D0H8L0_SPHPU